MQICTGRYWCCGYEHHSKEKVWNCEETTNIHISFFLSSASVQNLSDTVEKESHLKKTNSGLNHKINTSSLTCFQKLCPGWKLNQRAFLEKQRQVLVWPISSALPPPLPFLFFLPLSTFLLLATALWGEPTQTNTWELLRGKIQATRATAPVRDPPAATPAAKEVTGNVMLKPALLHLHSQRGFSV